MARYIAGDCGAAYKAWAEKAIVMCEMWIGEFGGLVYLLGRDERFSCYAHRMIRARLGVAPLIVDL